MSAIIEVLRKQKAALKEELQIEEQKEKYLQDEIETLKELIEIQGLEKALDTKLQTIKRRALPS